MKIAVLILAAGKSTRMGQPKQLLPWGDTSLIKHAIEQAQGVNAEVVVVLGANSELIGDHLLGTEVKIKRNPNYASGLGSSIVAGMEYVMAENEELKAVLIMLVDQPSVDTTYLSHVLAAHERYPDKVIATDYLHRLGVPALFPAAFFSELLTLGGDAGAGKILNAMQSGIHPITPPAPLYDLDTPEDYRRHEGDQEHR